ncbi:MAG: S41 family peptidase [Leptospiraceae bacterium]|nr:S41 family peptidase [Leptospiraceae bacterium]
MQRIASTIKPHRRLHLNWSWMLKSPRLLGLFFIIFYISFCGCNQAETPHVPRDFDGDNFEKVVRFVLGNYYDTRNINQKQSYIGAAEAALRVLPWSLTLMNREFYSKQAELLGPEWVIPGRAISISANDPYVIFVQDYDSWEKKSQDLKEKEKALYSKMSLQEQRAEVEKRRQRDKQIQDFNQQAWKKIDFGHEDFKRIVRWIELNQEKYSHLPDSHKGPDPYADDPFGMQHVYFAATNGFLQAIDPHSSIIDPGDWERMRSKAEDSTFEGIGALLRGGNQYDVVVESPLLGSPALKAGLRAGDIIRKVDTVATENLPLSEVVKMIKGPKDTVVKLEVERESGLSNVVIPIVRGVIEQKAVTSRLYSAKDYGKTIMGNRKIGLIRVTSFLYKDTPPSELVVQYYEDLKNEAGGKLDGLILDLRSNPGGYLQEAIDLSDLFLAANLPVVQVRGAENRVKRTSRPAVISGLPIIVLINAGSASASEIVASALMDHNAALVLGERSFGKATVQSIHPISPVRLKYTIARYYAPRGYTIQVYGVMPDVQVSPEVDGAFPARYREEDMWKHLPELDERETDPRRQAWAERLKGKVGENKAAEDYIKQHAKDPLKPDFMLIRVMQYFNALQQLPRP